MMQAQQLLDKASGEFGMRITHDDWALLGLFLHTHLTLFLRKNLEGKLASVVFLRATTVTYNLLSPLSMVDSLYSATKS